MSMCIASMKVENIMIILNSQMCLKAALIIACVLSDMIIALSMCTISEMYV